LRLALASQPAHAEDFLADLEVLTAGWESERRAWLLDRVAWRAVRGTPLPAALIMALAEALDD
jgi:hypothetical protein